MRLLYGLFLLMLIGLSANTEPSHPTIFYVPIGSETYMPTTDKNIEKVAIFYCECRLDTTAMKELVSLFEQSALGKFDNEEVRAKIRGSHSQWIYLDNFGGVKIGSSERQLNKKDFLRAQEILSSITTRRG